MTTEIRHLAPPHVPKEYCKTNDDFCEDILSLFFRFFPGDQVVTRLRRVNTRWNKQSKSHNLWRWILQKDFPNEIVDELPQDGFEKRYRSLYCTELNWQQKKYSHISLPSSNTATALNQWGFCVDNKYLYNLCEDGKIEVRDKNDGKLVINLISECQHDESLIRIFGDFITIYHTSGPDGGSFTKIWKKDNFELVLASNDCCHNFIVLDNSTVFGLGFNTSSLLKCWRPEQNCVTVARNVTEFIRSDNDLITLSKMDGKISFINTQDFTIRLRVDVENPKYLESCLGNLVCIHYDGSMSIINKNDGSLINHFAGFFGPIINQVEVMENFLFVIIPTKTQIYDLQRYHLLCTINASASTYCCTSDLLIVGLSNGNVEIRDRTDGKSQNTIPPLQGEKRIKKLQIRNDILFVGYEKTLVVWSLVKGQALWNEPCYGWHIDGNRLYISAVPGTTSKYDFSSKK